MFMRELFEMAKPLEAHRAKFYYHGASTEKAGLSILKNGIEPGDIVMPEKRTTSKKPNLNPVEGKVYITPELKYGQIYAIGGDLAGHEVPFNRLDKIGYLFVIDGKDLVDIEPDEDSIGEMIYWVANNKKFTRELQWLYNLARRRLTDKQWDKVVHAEVVMWAHAGKKLLPLMTDEQKLQLISLGAHVAHAGKIIPISAYKIDKTKTKDLKRDGSNFFEIAEKIK
jgi:hypothetical protein